MIDIMKTWITDYGIDGFRLDTVKHVNDRNLAGVWPGSRWLMPAAGKASEFFMFGEVFDGNPAYISTFTTEVPLPSVLDFGLQGRPRSFAARSEATDNVRDFFAWRRLLHRCGQQRLSAGSISSATMTSAAWVKRFKTTTAAHLMPKWWPGRTGPCVDVLLAWLPRRLLR